MSFGTTFFMWGINYVAQEIEEPFGGDQNDLPLHDMQKCFNASLSSLLSRSAKTPPEFTFDARKHQTLILSNMKRGSHRRNSMGLVEDELPELVRQEFSTANGLPKLLGREEQSPVTPKSSFVSAGSTHSGSGKRNVARGSKFLRSVVTIEELPSLNPVSGTPAASPRSPRSPSSPSSPRISPEVSSVAAPDVAQFGSSHIFESGSSSPRSVELRPVAGNSEENIESLAMTDPQQFLDLPAPPAPAVPLKNGCMPFVIQNDDSKFSSNV